MPCSINVDEVKSVLYNFRSQLFAIKSLKLHTSPIHYLYTGVDMHKCCDGGEAPYFSLHWPQEDVVLPELGLPHLQSAFPSLNRHPCLVLFYK